MTATRQAPRTSTGSSTNGTNTNTSNRTMITASSPSTPGGNSNGGSPSNRKRKSLWKRLMKKGNKYEDVNNSNGNGNGMATTSQQVHTTQAQAQSQAQPVSPTSVSIPLFEAFGHSGNSTSDPSVTVSVVSPSPPRSWSGITHSNPTVASSSVATFNDTSTASTLRPKNGQVATKDAAAAAAAADSGGYETVAASGASSPAPQQQQQQQQHQINRSNGSMTTPNNNNNVNNGGASITKSTAAFTIGGGKSVGGKSVSGKSLGGNTWCTKAQMTLGTNTTASMSMSRTTSATPSGAAVLLGNSAANGVAVRTIERQGWSSPGRSIMNPASPGSTTNTNSIKEGMSMNQQGLTNSNSVKLVTSRQQPLTMATAGTSNNNNANHINNGKGAFSATSSPVAESSTNPAQEIQDFASSSDWPLAMSLQENDWIPIESSAGTETTATSNNNMNSIKQTIDPPGTLGHQYSYEQQQQLQKQESQETHREFIDNNGNTVLEVEEVTRVIARVNTGDNNTNNNKNKNRRPVAVEQRQQQHPKQRGRVSTSMGRVSGGVSSRFGKGSALPMKKKGKVKDRQLGTIQDQGESNSASTLPQDKPRHSQVVGAAGEGTTSSNNSSNINKGSTGRDNAAGAARQVKNNNSTTITANNNNGSSNGQAIQRNSRISTNDGAPAAGAGAGGLSPRSNGNAVNSKNTTSNTNLYSAPASPNAAAPHLYAEINVPSKKYSMRGGGPGAANNANNPPAFHMAATPLSQRQTSSADVSLALTSISSLTGRDSLFYSGNNNGGGITEHYTSAMKNNPVISALWCPADLGNLHDDNEDDAKRHYQEENYFDYGEDAEYLKAKNMDGNGISMDNDGGNNQNPSDDDAGIMGKLVGAWNEAFRSTCRCFDIGGAVVGVGAGEQPMEHWGTGAGGDATGMMTTIVAQSVNASSSRSALGGAATNVGTTVNADTNATVTNMSKAVSNASGKAPTFSDPMEI